jgi:hypothetical protein
VGAWSDIGWWGGPGVARLGCHTTADGMIALHAHLQPHRAADVIAAIDQAVMSDHAPAGASLPQQRADALHTTITNGGTTIATEVVIHVTADGNHLTNGTPLSDHTVTGLLPDRLTPEGVDQSAATPESMPRTATMMIPMIRPTAMGTSTHLSSAGP